MLIRRHTYVDYDTRYIKKLHVVAVSSDWDRSGSIQSGAVAECSQVVVFNEVKLFRSRCQESSI